MDENGVVFLFGVFGVGWVFSDSVILVEYNMVFYLFMERWNIVSGY